MLEHVVWNSPCGKVTNYVEYQLKKNLPSFAWLLAYYQNLSRKVKWNYCRKRATGYSYAFSEIAFTIVVWGMWQLFGPFTKLQTNFNSCVYHFVQSFKEGKIKLLTKEKETEYSYAFSEVAFTTVVWEMWQLFGQFTKLQTNFNSCVYHCKSFCKKCTYIYNIILWVCYFALKMICILYWIVQILNFKFWIKSNHESSKTICFGPVYDNIKFNLIKCLPL